MKPIPWRVQLKAGAVCYAAVFGRASWFLANFSRAKRLTLYAGLIEVGTFALLIPLLLLSTRQVRG